MFGRRQRREERLYWKGFRDALVTGTAFGPAGKPALFDDDEPPAEWTRYRQGFEDGKRAAKRTHRDALVSEVRADIEPRFPDNQVLVFAPGLELSVVCPGSLAETIAEEIENRAARA